MDRTHRAELAIRESDIIVGYTRYIENISDLIDGKETISTGMTQEVDRCGEALRRAANGSVVALVSSGDPGVYGMAGLALELCAAEGLRIPIEIIPGVSAVNAAAARLGAPIMCDFATVSLSDLLVPWETIRKRLEAVAEADFVVAIYNPRSKKRVQQLEEAARILREHRSGDTPVGVCTAVGSEEERVELTDLDHFLELGIDMQSVVIVGNRSSKRISDWFVTPRGYVV